MSPSSRRAWIEIASVCGASVKSWVALLAEGVDRNIKRLRKAVKEPLVALLAEGVDRNHTKISDKTVQIRRPPRGGRG